MRDIWYSFLHSWKISNGKVKGYKYLSTSFIYIRVSNFTVEPSFVVQNLQFPRDVYNQLDTILKVGSIFTFLDSQYLFSRIFRSKFIKKELKFLYNGKKISILFI